MTIVDPFKKGLALQRHTRFLICYKCHVKNGIDRTTCKKCGYHELRKKHGKTQIKKG